MTIKEVSEKYHISQDTLRFVMTNCFWIIPYFSPEGKMQKRPLQAFCARRGRSVFLVVTAPGS
mgnify:FL=1